MKNKTLQGKSFNQGQTAVELAVFGAVLIFVIGIIVRTGLSSGQQQHHSLRALRVALKTSYEYSEGIRGKEVPGNKGDNGNASRNSASVIFIEDRLTADSGKYGAVDRTPLMLQSSGVHTRNLLMPVDFWESENVPRLDVYVNGKHFPFTTATIKKVDITGVTLLTRVPNHPKINDWLACGSTAQCDDRFDLDRDGAPDVPVAARPFFSWQWMPVNRSSIDTESGKNTVVDVDGDLYEERIMKLDGNIAIVMDFNEGDIDFSDDPPPGFDRDLYMFTYVEGSPNAGQGTYLEIKEGKLYSAQPGRQFISTASKKDSVDVIQRVFKLSNNTGRFCPPVLDPTIYTVGTLQDDFVQDANPLYNPVEVCNNCFSPANIERTCMDTGNNVIYIRSRIEDLHGRKWVTDISTDTGVNFTPVPIP